MDMSTELGETHTIKAINHFATDPMSCYKPECSNWEKYYGTEDVARAVGGTREIKGCKMFMFKRGNKDDPAGRCILMDRTFVGGFKTSPTMRQNNHLLHVGIRSCKKGTLRDKWCTNCNEITGLVLAQYNNLMSYYINTP